MARQIQFLTEKQQQIVRFMEKTLKEKRRPATLGEIATHIGKNGSTVHEHLQTIIKKGYVKKDGGYYLPVNTKCPTCGHTVV